MVRIGQIGVGKMGLSHLAIANMHSDAELVGVCDPASYMRDGLQRFGGFRTFGDYRKMFENERLDAVIVATPSHLHEEIVGAALDKDISVFCEKPFCLDVERGRRLAATAAARGLVNQVGYHARFLATFQEAKRIVSSGLLGRINHIKAEAYGAVVLRPTGGTWRSSRQQGGGCLYDYASHAIDLINYLVGAPTSVSGTILKSIFSKGVEDAVYSSLMFADGMTGQVEANWSDESFRKMFLRVTLWGANGRLNVDRQEIQTYVRSVPQGMQGFRPGWNIRYTTELTETVWYYLRGEEYSAQIDYFIRSVKEGETENVSSFSDASKTDQVMALMVANHAGSVPDTPSVVSVGAGTTTTRERLRSRLIGRRK